MAYVFSRPVAEKPSYLPNEQVEFTLHNPNYSIIQGSIRLSGTVSFFHNNGVLNNTHFVYHDNIIGFEGLIASTIVKFNGRTYETINDYGRMRKAMLSALETEKETLGDSPGACRGATGAMGPVTRDHMLPANNPDFSFKLNVCLNTANSPIGSNKGIISLFVRLEQPLNFFSGPDANATTTYTISNLIIEYRIVPEVAEDSNPLSMTVINTMKQTIDSSNGQISLSLQIPTKSIFATFLSQPNSLEPTYNYYELSNPAEGVTSIEWSINDSLAFEKFPFQNDMEVRYNYLMTLNGITNRNNSLTIGQILDKSAYGIGFNYYRYFDVNSKFGLNVQLATAPANPYFLYLYFAGAITV